MDPTIRLPLEVVYRIFLLLSPSQDIPTAMLVSERWKTILDYVIEMRAKHSLSSLSLRPPLRWFQAKTLSNTGSPTSGFNKAPTSRFGATTILKDDNLYVFGGATSELTAFNDMWVFNLSSAQWRRITKQGDLPSPRAFAKCGFIGNTLYLFGGCHTYRYGLNQITRIDWLDDMYSFCIETQTWKCVKLRRASEYMNQPPPIIIGQSGTFLPSSDSSIGFPNAIVLFGGYSRPGGICVNTGYVVLPSLSQWFELPDSLSTRKPPGRYGHSSCAVDAYRMVVIGGNLRPPKSPYFSPSSFTSEQTATVSPQEVLPSVLPTEFESQFENQQTRSQHVFEGDPAMDIWLLTRSRNSKSLAFSEIPWFWTRVECRSDCPENPPPDFYYSVAVSLPLFVEKNYSSSSNKSSNETAMEVELTRSQENSIKNQTTDYFSASVLLISSASKYLLNSLPGQSNLFRSKRIPGADQGMQPNGFSSIHPSSSTYTSSYYERIDHEQSDASHEKYSLTSQPDDLISMFNQKIVPFSIFDKVTGVNLRKRFSSLNSSKKPLVAYTLRLSIPTFNNTSSTISNAARTFGYWIGPGKPVYGELLSAPPECFGFSCVYGQGSIFLFGGISGTNNTFNSESEIENDTDEYQFCRVRSPHPSSQSGNLSHFEREHEHIPPGIIPENDTHEDNRKRVHIRNLFNPPHLYILQPSVYVSYFG